MNASMILYDIIPWCGIVEYDDFKKDSESYLKKFYKSHKACYLLLHHTDERTLIHWTTPDKIEPIKKSGLLPKGDEFSNFGKGIYCFDAKGRDNTFGRNADERIIGVMFVSSDWYQCVATDDVITSVRYCFVANPIPAKQLVFTTTGLDQYDTVEEEVRNMGYNDAVLQGADMNQSLHDVINSI